MPPALYNDDVWGYGVKTPYIHNLSIQQSCVNCTIWSIYPYLLDLIIQPTASHFIAWFIVAYFLHKPHVSFRNHSFLYRYSSPLNFCQVAIEFKPLLIYSVVFCVITSHSVGPTFQRTCRLIFRLTIESHNPEDHNVSLYPHENLKSYASPNTFSKNTTVFSF